MMLQPDTYEAKAIRELELASKVDTLEWSENHVARAQVYAMLTHASVTQHAGYRTSNG